MFTVVPRNFIFRNLCNLGDTERYDVEQSSILASVWRKKAYRAAKSLLAPRF